MLFRLSLVESTFMSQSKEVQMFSIQDLYYNIYILIYFNIFSGIFKGLHIRIPVCT